MQTKSCHGLPSARPRTLKLTCGLLVAALGVFASAGAPNEIHIAASRAAEAPVAAARTADVTIADSPAPAMPAGAPVTAARTSAAPRPNASAAAASQGPAYPDPALILVWSPERRLRAFSDYAGTFPTREIPAGGQPYPLPAAPRDFSSLSYELDGERFTLDDYIRETQVAGLIVVNRGRVLYERYVLGNSAATLWVGYSVAKSVVSLLFGAAIAEGYIASLDEPVIRYLPRLAGGAYDGVTIAQLLQMSSGVGWREDYEDPQADVSQAPRAILPFIDYMRARPTASPPGASFNYSTGETDLAGAVLRAAIGNNLATYLSHRIWRPFGMEAAANWMLGAPGGAEFGGCCISANLRDYARIGLFALREGITADGRRLLPADWMARSTTPADTYPGYGYFWWLRPGGAYAALGIFGQLIWVDPRSQTVVAVHSAWPRATDESLSAHRWALVDAVAAAVADEG